MKKSYPILELVRKLDVSERRYFQLFALRHFSGNHQNKYLALFKLIQKNPDYSITRIKDEMKKKGLETSFFAADCNYLHQMILQSLNQFHNKKSDAIIIRNHLNSIEVLFYKGLFKQAIEKAETAQKQAAKVENFPLLLEVLFWKKRCQGYSSGLLNAHNVNSEIHLALEKLKNLQEIIELYYESYRLHIDKDKYDVVATRNKFKKLLSHPLLKSEENALSQTSKIYFQLIFAHSHYSENNSKKELERLINIEKIIQAFPAYKTEYPLDYVSIYNRQLRLEKYIDKDAFIEDLTALKKINFKPNTKTILEYRIFIITKINEIEFSLVNHVDLDSKKIESEITKVVDSSDIAVEPFYIIYLYYLCAHGHFKCGAFENCIETANLVLNRFHYSERPPLIAKMEILNIQAHYELGNFSISNSRARNVLRRYTKENILSDTEASLLNFFVNAKSNKISTRQKQQLAKLLEKNQTNDRELFSKGYVYDNYLPWIAKLVEHTEAVVVE